MADGKQWVLLVEDNFMVSNVLATELNREGFQVICAANGAEAKERIEFCTPDCILLDLLMPKVHGHAFLADFRKRDKETPVIITSSVEEQPRLVATIEQLGIHGWAQKPVDGKRLKSLIEDALEAKRLLAS